MAEALSDVVLRAITERDEAAGDGLTGPDYRCAEDRHTLLVELDRMRGVVMRLRTGIPVAGAEGAPWLSE